MTSHANRIPNGINLRSGWFSYGRFDYNGAYKSHDLLKFKPSHWLKLQHSYWRANFVKDFFYK